MINISDKLKDIQNIAKKKKLIISTAESCTGGLIAKYLTDTAGASSVYDSSIITYSNQSKISLLGVKSETIEKYGAVSEEVVNEMCRGLLMRNEANLGISISGIMGPCSDNTDKKIGAIWTCFMYKDSTKTYHLQLNGSRSENREEAAKNVILNLYEFINQL